MRILASISFVVASVGASLLASPALANNASSYSQVQCPSGYTREAASSARFRCSRQVSGGYSYKRASCNGVTNALPGVNWVLAYNKNSKRWSCYAKLITGDSWQVINNNTCAQYPGYTANSQANNRDQTCRKATSSIQYKHPTIHTHN